MIYLNGWISGDTSAMTIKQMVCVVFYYSYYAGVILWLLLTYANIQRENVWSNIAIDLKSK